MQDILTNRQKEILKVIIDEYTITAQPVGSQILIDKYFPNLSSATIRNEMVILEKNGLITKYYSSSGRIPSLQGYEYYEKFLPNDISNKFKMKLKDILSKRNLTIDQVIDQSVTVINEITNLPAVSTKLYNNDLLKKIELVAISEQVALIIIVTSSGQIIKHEIVSQNLENIDDMIICVNVFNDRLVDTPIKELEDKIDFIKELIRDKVKSYEFVVQEFVEKIFLNINWTEYKIQNSKEITVHPEFTNVEKFQKILNLLNDVTVWKQIALSHLKTGKTSITYNDEVGIDDISVASTMIQLGDINREISIVGPNRITYAKAKSLLKFLKEELEKYYRNEH